MPRAPRPAPNPGLPAPIAPPTAREWLLLAALLLLAWGLRRERGVKSSGLPMASPLYVRLAEDLARGEREPAPAHHGYPLLVSLAARVLPGRELPGRAVSLVASLGLVALVWA